LTPFQLVKHILPKWTIPALKRVTDNDIRQDFEKVVEIKGGFSSGDSLWIPRWMAVLLAVWLCLVLVFAFYQIAKYKIDISKLLADSEPVSVRLSGEMAEVLVNRRIRTPYTVGFIKQSIIVPEESLGHPCFEMCYRHENQHRKNHDSLVKLLCIVIICVHWFNLAAILLLLLYRMTAEYICDASAVEGCTDEEKKTYARLLIELSVADESVSMVWRNNISSSEKLMRRRIDYMMKKKGLMKKGVAVVVALVTMLASASTIFAYEPFSWMDKDGVEAIDTANFGSFACEQNNESYDFSVSDTIFMYKDGTQIPVIENDVQYVICNHIMVDGYYNVHFPGNSGGCTVKVYKAKRCTRCGYIDVGSLYSTNIYPVCPHK
ncbi:MAG: M56 family metallopeptidase, partial [Eubacteriales bacterium]|nr:M56 family metallopeptidase [Eubacteriales bacterium]